MAIEPYTGPLPDGWHGGEAITKKWNSEFIHLYRVRRNCASCGSEIRIDVTRAALLGSKKNAGLLLRNCPTCRAVRKAGGTGSRGGTSRPGVEGSIVPDELEALKMANGVMREELKGLYSEMKKLRDRLAIYELPEAMKAIGGEAVQNTTNGDLPKSYPWA